MRTDLRPSRRRLDVGTEVIVEAPGADLFPDHQQLGCVTRIGKLRHHAVEARQVLGEHAPFAIVTLRAHD